MVQCEICKNREHSVCRGFLDLKDDDEYQYKCFQCENAVPINGTEVC